MKTKIQEMESNRSISIDTGLIEAQTINQALRDQKKELDENLMLAEEDLVYSAHQIYYQDQTDSYSAQVDSFQNLLSDLGRQLAEFEVQVADENLELEARVRLELERIADLSSTVQSHESDLGILQDCLNSRKDKLFLVREERKGVDREMKLCKEVNKTTIKDLIQERHQLATKDNDIQTKISKLNSEVDDVEDEISRLKRNVYELEKDDEADIKLEEELRFPSRIKQTLSKNRGLAGDIEVLKDQNSALQTGYHVDQMLETGELQYGSERYHFPLLAAKTQGSTLQSESQQRSPQKPVNQSAEKYEERSTRDHHNFSALSNPHEQSFGIHANPLNQDYTREEFDDTENILQEMRQDLRAMKEKKQGIVGNILQKIHLIEEELDLNRLL